MAIEIERKFLLATQDLAFLTDYVGTPIVQGYLHDEGMTSRVRIAGDTAYLTLKGKARGLARPEFEYPIPLADAKELLSNHVVGRLITKTRYRIPAGRHIWEVDVFSGHLKGLVVAEIELTNETEKFRKPRWVGIEVTKNKAFTNKSLAMGKRIPLVPVAQAA